MNERIGFICVTIVALGLCGMVGQCTFQDNQRALARINVKNHAIEKGYSSVEVMCINAEYERDMTACILGAKK